MPAPPPREPYLFYRPLGAQLELLLLMYQHLSLLQALLSGTRLFVPRAAPESSSGLACPAGFSARALAHAGAPAAVCASDLHALLGAALPLEHCLQGALGLLALVFVRRARDAGLCVRARLPRVLARPIPGTEAGAEAGEFAPHVPQRVAGRAGRAVHCDLEWWTAPAAWARLALEGAYVAHAARPVVEYPARAADVPAADACDGLLAEFYRADSVCFGPGYVPFVLALRVALAATAGALDWWALGMIPAERAADRAQWQ